VARAADPPGIFMELKLIRECLYAGGVVVSVVQDEEAKRTLQAVLRNDTSNVTRYVSARMSTLLPWQTQQHTFRLTPGIDEVSHNIRQRDTVAGCPQVKRQRYFRDCRSERLRNNSELLVIGFGNPP
jgi:hypothetical protein